MNYNEDRARQEQAAKAVRILSNLAAYQPVADWTLAPPSLGDRINVPAGKVMLTPNAHLHPDELAKFLREFRSTAVVVEPGSTNDGQRTFYMTVVHPADGEIRRYPSLRLWLDLERNLFLVPYPQAEGGACFVMDERGVRSVAAPWKHEADYEFGLKHGDALLMAP